MEVIEKLLDRIIEKSPVAGAILVGLWGAYAIYRGLRDKVIAVATEAGRGGDPAQAESNDRLHAQLENERLRRDLETILTARCPSSS